MDCPTCGRAIPPGPIQICLHCNNVSFGTQGAAVGTEQCPKCGHHLEVDDKFCMECGKPRTASVAKLAPETSNRLGWRLPALVLVTLLGIGIVGSAIERARMNRGNPAPRLAATNEPIAQPPAGNMNSQPSAPKEVWLDALLGQPIDNFMSLGIYIRPPRGWTVTSSVPPYRMKDGPLADLQYRLEGDYSLFGVPYSAIVLTRLKSRHQIVSTPHVKSYENDIRDYLAAQYHPGFASCTFEACDLFEWSEAGQGQRFPAKRLQFGFDNEFYWVFVIDRYYDPIEYHFAFVWHGHTSPPPQPVTYGDTQREIASRAAELTMGTLMMGERAKPLIDRHSAPGSFTESRVSIEEQTK